MSSTAGATPLSRLAHTALGGQWRQWLGPALDIDRASAGRIAAQAQPLTADETAKLASLARVAEQTNLAEILNAVVLGLQDDGVPPVLIAAHLSALAASLSES